jgi:hypothetical protein
LAACPSGPFKGKKIEFASTTEIEMFFEIAEDFMHRILDFEPGDYLITDESSLWDFTGRDKQELDDIYKKIQEVYDLDVSDIPTGNLLEIFRRIHRRTYGAPSEQISCLQVYTGRVPIDEAKSRSAGPSTGFDRAEAAPNQALKRPGE